MDFNALQHKLFELDPSDPKEDLRKLAEVAGGAEVAPTKDYVTESVEVPEGSMPLGIDSVADFAALAGVRIDEKQKMGSAGQAKGKDPMPSAKAGRTKHPLKDKLVGEGDLDEGPLDSIGKAIGGAVGAAKSGFDAGRESPGAITRATQKLGRGTSAPSKNDKKTSDRKVKTSISPAMLNRMLSVDDFTSFQQAIMNIKAGNALNLRQNQAMAQAFRNLMAMDPQQTQQVMQMLRRMEATESKSNTQNKIQNESIKDQLWAALNEKLS